MKIKKVLVSQPAPESGISPFAQLEGKHNVKVIFRPFIKTEVYTAKEFRGQKVNLPDYSALCFTSPKCVDYFFQVAEEMRFKVGDEMKYFCLSESVANYLQKYINYRKRKVFFSEAGTLGDMMGIVAKHLDETILVIRPETNNEEIVNAFDKSGASYKLACICRTVSNDFGPDEPFDYDMLLFFSPHGVATLKNNFPDWEQGETVIGCSGKLTAQAIRDAGLRLDIDVPNEKYSSLPPAVDDWIKENHKRR